MSALPSASAPGTPAAVNGSSSREWTPSSWRTRTVAQDVAYPDAAALEAVTQRLAVLPGLVTPNEVDRLRKQLADVASGKVSWCARCGSAICDLHGMPRSSNELAGLPRRLLAGA